MKKLIIVLTCIAIFISCKKDAGDGGNSSILGTILKDVRVVLTNPVSFQGTFPASDQDVYIIYGDHVSPDDRVQANYEGDFEFKYLRPGKYKVYVYSKDTNAVAVPWDEDHMAIIQELEISDKKQEVKASDMTIYDTN